ncbi:RHS repeat domain-containing protein [Flavobacterium ardleyense]|uniref:RHS repeat domain-containing protein n=1 Tax=Flavobacterium ardleyense TaxID=2038737 RepID=A0ABW5Z8L1_9FLAO
MRGERKFSILADHLGTPTHLFSEQGYTIWVGSLDSYGKLRIEKGEIGSCPFRYQGQYEDIETDAGGSQTPKKAILNL